MLICINIIFALQIHTYIPEFVIRQIYVLTILYQLYGILFALCYINSWLASFVHVL